MRAFVDLSRLRKLEEEPELVKELIDHTNLRPDATLSDLESTCAEAAEYGLFACCVPLFFVSRAKEVVRGRSRVVTVVGFPHGNTPTRAKVEEARLAMEGGADEVDMVINVSLVKSGRVREALEEVAQVLEVVRSYGGVLKVIEETGYLTDSEVLELTRELGKLGVDFVKTSTGFGPRGASFEDVLLMRKALEGTRTKVKAAGGIRGGLQAILFYAVGADRIGTSSGVKIATEAIRFLSK